MPGAVTAEARSLAGYRLAGPDDDDDVRELLRRQSFGQTIRVSLRREPDASHAAGIEGDRHLTMLALDHGANRVIGMGSRAVRPVWLAERPTRVGYLGLLRADSLDRRAVRHLVQGYRELERLRLPDERPFDLTAIVTDNERARRLLEGGKHGLPVYRPVGRLVTYVTSAGHRHRIGAGIRRGTDALLPAIADCLQRNLKRYAFAPVWSVEDLRCEVRTRGLSAEDFFVRVDGDRVVACAALWDQRAFKQTVVQGYAPSLARWRRAANLALGLTRRPTLPPPGSELRMAFVSHLAADDDRDSSSIDLIQAVRTEAAKRGIEYVSLGLARSHPLLEPVMHAVRGRVYPSTLYLVYRSQHEDRLPALRGLVPHVEVATI